MNIKDWGAVGDGVVDDTAAIFSAMAQAGPNGVIYAPANESSAEAAYKVSAQLWTDYPLSIEGDGMGSTIFKTTSPTSPVFSFISTDDTYYRDFSVEGVATYRNQQYGLAVGHGTNVSIERVEASGVGSVGIYPYDIDQFTISGCYVHDTFADGMNIHRGCTNGTITGNHTQRTGDDGIGVISYIESGNPYGPNQNLTLIGNTINDSKARGIAVAGGEDIVVMGNIVDGTSACGITVYTDGSYNTYRPNRVSVALNHIKNAGRYDIPRATQEGLRVSYADNVTALNNRIINSLGPPQRIESNCTGCRTDIILQTGAANYTQFAAGQALLKTDTDTLFYYVGSSAGWKKVGF